MTVQTSHVTGFYSEQNKGQEPYSRAVSSKWLTSAIFNLLYTKLAINGMQFHSVQFVQPFHLDRKALVRFLPLTTY